MKKKVEKRFSKKNGFNKTITIDGKQYILDFEKIQEIKALDKEKLAIDNEMIALKIKETEQKYKNLNIIFDPKIMNQISDKREKELRSTVQYITQRLYNKRKGVIEDTSVLYNEILTNIKSIKEKIIDDVQNKKNDVLQRIELRLGDCNYRLKKKLDEKLADQEIVLRNLLMFTYEMQKVKDNYEAITQTNQKISKENYELEQKISFEKNRNCQLQSLLREYKNRINQLAANINEKKGNNNINSSKNNTNCEEEKNINYYNNEKEEEEALSTANNLNIDTDFSNKNEAVYYKTENNLYSGRRIIANLNNHIRNIQNKTKFVDYKFSNIIIENPIYLCITDTIDQMKKSQNLEMYGFNSKLLSQNMKNLPIQNHEFRKEFMNKLLNNKLLLDAINVKENIKSFERVIRPNQK